MTGEVPPNRSGRAVVIGFLLLCLAISVTGIFIARAIEPETRAFRTRHPAIPPPRSDVPPLSAR